MSDLTRMLDALEFARGFFEARAQMATPGSEGAGKLHECAKGCADAMALLKAQEPRVMTLEEVVALPEGGGDVWIENTSMPGIPPWIIAATLTEKMDWQELGALWFSDDCCHYVSDYNIDTADGWRCWTARPTDEQREATPWN